MQGNTKRKALTRSVVVAGSVCRTKMRMDEAKGGIEVLQGTESHKKDTNVGYRRLRRNRRHSVTFERRKRSNSAASDEEENALIGKSSVQLRKVHSDLSNSPKTLIKNSVEVREEEQVLLIGDGSEGAGEDKEVEEEEEEDEVEIEIEEVMKSFVDKEMDEAEDKPKKVEEEKEGGGEEEIPVSSQDEEKNQNLENMSSMDVVEKKQNPMIDHRAMNPDPAALPHFEVAEEMFGSASIKHNGMQSIENLVMWRDVSKSAFVFGVGTFFLISSSYAKDINFSLISASSYVGLVYLAFVFLCKSFLHRGETMQFDERDERHMVVEEDAVWLLKMLLPYINELVFKLRNLFSGDPLTTLKLAALLFVMARCGSIITIWSLVKLIFFGVFTIPKVCSSNSAQLAKFGKFWLDRLRDGWESCTHKKAVATAIFAFVWNISSTVARIWAFFMLVVAVKLYQQCAAEYSWSGPEEDEGQEDSMAGQSQGLDCTHKEVGQVEMK